MLWGAESGGKMLGFYVLCDRGLISSVEKVGRLLEAQRNSRERGLKQNPWFHVCFFFSSLQGRRGLAAVDAKAQTRGWCELSWVRQQDGEMGPSSALSWKSSENDLIV